MAKAGQNQLSIAFSKVRSIDKDGIGHDRSKEVERGPFLAKQTKSGLLFSVQPTPP